MNILFSLIRFCECVTVNLLTVVGSSGVEPPTSCLSGMRSNLLSYEPVLFAQSPESPHSEIRFLEPMVFGFSTDGGDEGIRTLDPLLAGQVLSQLSYTPIMGLFNSPWKSNNNFKSNFVLRRLFCFFVSYEGSFFNLSCSP